MGSIKKSTHMTGAGTDIHVESIKLQREIESHLSIKGSELSFEFQQSEGKTKLDLITISPRHNQSFLFQSVLGIDKLDALRKMLDYVKSYKDKYQSYTVQWIAKGEKELHTSYFRAGNMYDALDKLYYGRDINTITVFSIVLNPVA
ncbi:hypothetical protein [Roseivirga echinicomitans]|uniref:hypothetical protein n=1 Tax=Roseivirga echinicomitans TaxID=296218 RepID=UPI001FDFF99B|nr:hypothetical protein [Roseivirga echinicomitans]